MSEQFIDRTKLEARAELWRAEENGALAFMAGVDASSAHIAEYADHEWGIAEPGMVQPWAKDRHGTPFTHESAFENLYPTAFVVGRRVVRSNWQAASAYPGATDTEETNR